MKMKLIALAALLASGSVQAEGGIAYGFEDFGNGGEMFLNVWDQAGKTSYTLDLNITMYDFIAQVTTPGASLSYLADANMTQFLSGVTDYSQLVFTLGGFDNSGATATDFYQFVTTASDIGDPDTNNNLKLVGGAADTFLGNVNGYLISSVGNSIIVTDPSLVAYAGSAQTGHNWGSEFNGISTGVVGEDLNLYLFSQTTGVFAQRNSPSTYAPLLQGNNQVFAHLDANGNLVITAVPEAETYAMMLAGLGLVGFMAARRRKLA